MTTKEIYPLRSTETMTILSDKDLKASTHLMMKLTRILEGFDENHTKPNFDPIPILTEISRMLEKATDLFIKNDPDPLDDRHPHRTHPDSMLGNILKLIFKNDDFMTKLVVSYILARDNPELSIQGCRLLLACVPGLDSKVVFSEPDDFVPRLYHWAGAEGTNETLQGYAMCLLAAALENTENASKYRNENAILVPFALNRLRELQARSIEQHQNLEGPTDFSNLNGASNEPSTSKVTFEIPSVQVSTEPENVQNHENGVENPTFSNAPPPPKKRRTEPCLTALHRSESKQRVPSFHNLKNLDDSNSRWDVLQPFLIGTQQVYPLSLATYQRFILQFLAACGEYQDLLQQVFEGNALDLLLEYIDLEKTKDVRLTFDALKYLTSLLVHRKFALEFIEKNGIPALLRLPKTSLASVGVVTCFYYIAYNMDVMEMLCQMSDEVVDETVQYILWCLEHSHESGMASACMFFSQALYFKAILRRFDQFDGPRKLYNYISTLNLMQFGENDIDLTDEQVHTSTQCVRGVCTTFKCYILAHIFIKVEHYKKHYGNVLPCGMRFPAMLQCGEHPDYKSMKGYEEVSAECESIVLEMLRFTGHTFHEIQNLKILGMIKMLLAVRVFSRDWMSISAGLRNDMCCHALESLRMILCQPSIQTELLTVHNYSHSDYDGITILLQTALGRWDEESSLRMAALSCIQRCIYVEPECWKTIIQRMKTEQRQSSSKRNSHSKYEIIMNHLETMWTEVRKADGIMALVNLINCKTPLTEADSIRRLATNTLAGLARHPEVRQILSKLPLIAQSGLQILMREPVCSDKRDIHAAFCKEACLLLSIVTGRKMMNDHQATELQASDKSHRQWVVENTNVSFNQVELLQLIHDHLVKSNLNSVAAMLKTEAKLPDRPASRAASISIMNKPFPSSGNSNFTKLDEVYPTLAPRTLESEIGGISAKRPSHASSYSSPIATRSHSIEEDVFATPTLPRRYTTSGAFAKKLTPSPARSKQRPVTPGDEVRPNIDLNHLVSDYFRNQHSSCKNPVTTCPPFSLFFPHKCPERPQKTPVMKNMALRLINQELLRPNQRIVSDWSNERTIFSRFRNLKTMHDSEESYTRAVFSVDDEHLIVGHFNGELHWINVDTGADDGHTNCHGSALTNIDPSKDGSMILTSSAYSRPLSALWRLGQNMQRVHIYREDTCVRFANTTSERIIGTCREKASVYDTETNHVLDSYMTGTLGLHYEKNYASFSPDDKMIFSDGLLWDVRNRNAPIHTFDRLNNKTKFGTFHPHGTQIIINSEVYDIRTFRMVHHVPELSGCKLVFNSTGNIMFATETSNIHRPDYPDMIYSSLRSFDTMDYSALTTVEGRRPTIDITSSNHDQKLCVIEQTRPIMSDYMIQSSTQLRVIEVGRLRDSEDENEEEEEEQREDHATEDSDDSEEENEEGGNSPGHGSVFDALGRLDEDSDSDHSIEDDDDDDSSLGDFDFEAILNRVIRRQAQRRRQRANAVMEDNEEAGDSDDEDDGGVDDDENEDELDLDEDADDEEEEDDVDPDFDMEEAIDELVDAVDDEINAEELNSDDDSGSWRTASQVGSDDINLDDLDVEDRENQEEEAQEEAPEVPVVVPEVAPPPVQEDPVAAARRAYLERGLRGFRLRNDRGVGRRGSRDIGRGRGHYHHRHRNLINMNQAEILEARAEEQRAQFMEAIAREGGEVVNEQAEQNANNDSDDEMWHSEEEEINSVSTTALNPAMRRRNRRLQDDNDAP